MVVHLAQSNSSAHESFF